jgi:transcriptional regulator with XRE-family HTH domain
MLQERKVIRMDRKLSLCIIWALNKAREERGMSVAELSRRAKMTEIALGTTFRGKRKLSGCELWNLCEVLNLSLADIKILIMNADKTNPEFQYLLAS